ncbi:MAG: hypothetical protein WD534_17495 [Phycisphaeraceae bacterium]
MDSRWLGLIIFLLVTITAVSFMRSRSAGGGAAGERPAPDVGELRVLALDDARTIRIQGRLLRDHRQAYYYQVESAGEIVQPPTFFGSLAPGSPLLSFTWHQTADGQRVGVATDTYAREILILHDFATGESWPAHDGNESVEQLQARGRAMLAPLNADHPDKTFTVRSAEGLRPLPPPIPRAVEPE